MNDRTYLDPERRDIAYDTALALQWDSLFDFTVHRAVKEHKCSGSPSVGAYSSKNKTCGDHGDGVIQPGEYYVRVVWAAPWYEVRMDEDTEQVGEWIVSKYHPQCVPNTSGYWD